MPAWYDENFDDWTGPGDQPLENRANWNAGDWHNGRFDIEDTGEVKISWNGSETAVSNKVPSSEDYWVQILAKCGAFYWAAACVRAVAATLDSYHALLHTDGNTYLYRVKNNVFTLLTSAATPNHGDETWQYVRIQAEGTGATVTLKLWVNTTEPQATDTPLITYSDTHADRITAKGAPGMNGRYVIGARITEIKADIVAAGGGLSIPVAVHHMKQQGIL